MIEPYQLWGIRPARMALVKLDGFKSISALKRAWRKTLEKGTARSLEARLYMTDKDFTVINHQMETVELREYNSSTERDQRILDEAVYFTVTAFLGVGRYDHHEVSTLREARTLGKSLAKENQKDYMIYAINKQGNSAFVETKGYKNDNKRPVRRHPLI